MLILVEEERKRKGRVFI